MPPRRTTSSRATGRIEIRGRFIEHEDFWVHGEHSGDRHAAPLATRQVMGSTVGEIGFADSFQRLLHPDFQLGSSETEVGRAETHIFFNRRHEQLIVRILKDEPEPSPDLAKTRRLES